MSRMKLKSMISPVLPKPTSNQGRISDESPVGAALIGHKTGDKVDVTLPNGNILELHAFWVSAAQAS